MTPREIFLRVLEFQSAPRTVNWEFGYWGGTIQRWYGEGLARRTGLPEGTVLGDVIAGPGLQWPETSYDERLFLDQDVAGAFGFDPGFSYLHVNQWLCPRFEEKVLEETARKPSPSRAPTASPAGSSRTSAACPSSWTGP